MFFLLLNSSFVLCNSCLNSIGIGHFRHISFVISVESIFVPFFVLLYFVNLFLQVVKDLWMMNAGYFQFHYHAAAAMFSLLHFLTRNKDSLFWSHNLAWRCQSICC